VGGVRPRYAIVIIALAVLAVDAKLFYFRPRKQERSLHRLAWAFSKCIRLKFLFKTGVI
jgi:hypothetical protein